MRRAIALLLAGLALAAFVFAVAPEAAARANIRDIAGIGPNQYELIGSKANGTATKYVVDTLGWNATRALGNVGIGGGDVGVFDLYSPDEVEYPNDAFMCGDVSMQPWTPALKRPVPEKEAVPGANAPENATGNGGQPAVNVSGQGRPDDAGHYDIDTAEAGADTDTELAPESPANAETEGVSPIYAAYHPIRYLRPVQDIMYEHPLATPGTAYGELLGFMTPSGVPVNVGMKCTAYGY